MEGTIKVTPEQLTQTASEFESKAGYHQQPDHRDDQHGHGAGICLGGRSGNHLYQ